MIKKCPVCDRKYYYDVEECIFCNSAVKPLISRTWTVEGVTKVAVPSPEHKKVPYYNALLRDENNNLLIRKMAEEPKIGEVLPERTDEKTEKQPAGAGICIGVIGTGVTGIGIAEVALEKGMRVRLVSRTEERIKKASAQIESFIAKGRTGEQKQGIMERFLPTASLTDLKDADLIIESVLEDKETKDSCFLKLDKICKQEAIITSNTSSLSISRLAENISHPERFAGFHFFNPVPKMDLVEIVKGEKTNQSTVDFLVSAAKALEKTPVILKDSPSFVVNRLLIPYLNDAVLLLEQGVASKEDIDSACRLGLNYPMGPLALIDLIGVDVFAEIMDNLHQQTGDKRFIPARTAQRMIKQGKLGRKTGEGFYVYPR